MINFASSPAGDVVGTGIPNVYALEAGTVADLQRLINEQVAVLAAAVPASRLLAVGFGAAGDGSRFACALTVSVGTSDANYLTTGETALDAPLFSSFVATNGARSRIVVAGGGTAKEAADALTAAVTAVKVAGPGGSGSIGCAHFGVELVGSANGAQWLAGTVLADLVNA